MWKVCETSDGGFYVYDTETGNVPASKVDRREDADKIAVVPDMLKALIEAIQDSDDLGEVELDTLYHMREAIAKARGKGDTNV